MEIEIIEDGEYLDVGKHGKVEKRIKISTTFLTLEIGVWSSRDKSRDINLGVA